MKLLIPIQTSETLQSIDLNTFIQKGIKLLLLDIDNTIIPRGDKQASQEILDWLALAKQKGLYIALMSNNSRKLFPFLNNHADLYHCLSLKPFSICYKRIMKKFEVSPTQTVMIGDQIFTDVLGANRLGIHSILVRRQKEYGKFTRKLLHRIEDKIWEKFD